MLGTGPRGGGADGGGGGGYAPRGRPSRTCPPAPLSLEGLIASLFFFFPLSVHFACSQFSPPDRPPGLPLRRVGLCTCARVRGARLVATHRRAGERRRAAWRPSGRAAATAAAGWACRPPAGRARPPRRPAGPPPVRRRPPPRRHRLCGSDPPLACALVTADARPRRARAARSGGGTGCAGTARRTLSHWARGAPGKPQGRWPLGRAPSAVIAQLDSQYGVGLSVKAKRHCCAAGGGKAVGKGHPVRAGILGRTRLPLCWHARAPTPTLPEAVVPVSVAAPRAASAKETERHPPTRSLTRRPVDDGRRATGAARAAEAAGQRRA